MFAGLTDRSFSTWDAVAHRWVVCHGTFTVAVGSSSTDLRLHGSIDV